MKLWSRLLTNKAAKPLLLFLLFMVVAAVILGAGYGTRLQQGLRADPLG